MLHSPKKVTWIFLILFLLFVVPLMLASWLSYTKNPFSSHTTNLGELIQPPLDLNQLILSDNKKIKANHWLLLYVNPAVCDKQCKKILYNIRQVRTATGKDMNRVERAILTFSDSPADPHLEALLKTEFAGTLHWITAKQNFTTWLQNDPNALKIVLQDGGIYIADPLGNAMMFYPTQSDPMDMFKDLTHLLKLSHIG